MISLPLLIVTGVFIFISLLTYMGFAPIPTPSFDTTTISLTNGYDTTTISPRVATTYRQQYIGLSRTTTIDDNDGMLFVFNSEKERTIAMRAMSFPLDIIFIDEDGTITHIATADAPTGLTGYFLQERHTARCKTVLETPAGWAEKHNINEGDTATIQEL